MPETFVVNVFECPRCGGRHEWLEFRLLQHANSNVTHFAECPLLEQPILVAWDGRIASGQSIRPRDALPVRYAETFSGEVRP